MKVTLVIQNILLKLESASRMLRKTGWISLDTKKIIYKDAIHPIAKQYMADFDTLHSGHISKIHIYLYLLIHVLTPIIFRHKVCRATPKKLEKV
jgi:hypothetical protein